MPVAKSNRQWEMVNELRSLRSSRSLSRRELAELVDVNVQTIGALERGHYSPSLYLALLIAKALEVDVSQVFWLDSEVDTSAASGEQGKRGTGPRDRGCGVSGTNG